MKSLIKKRIVLSFCIVFSVLTFIQYHIFSQDATWLKDITHEVGLDSVIGTRILLVDVNGDNYPDLLWGTGNINKNHYYLYLNVPNPDTSSPYKRIYKDFTKESNINANRNPAKDGRITDVANLADVNNDGYPDLITSIYYHRLQMYLDTLDPGDRSEVLLNDGQGHFTLKLDNGVYQYGLTNSTGFAFLDYDLDGNIDFCLSQWFYDYANDIKQASVLFKGNGDGSFKVVDDNAIRGVAQPLYGINATDIDNDGWQEIITSPYCRSTGSIFKNSGGGSFVDVAQNYNYTSQLLGGDNGQPLCQWSAQPADFDNDGDMDLLQVEVHGGYDPGEGRTHIAVNGGQSKGYALTWDLDRIKRDAPTNSHLGDQGGIWFDLDGDGWQDIAIGQMGYPAANLEGQERLYILRQNANHYFDDISKALGIYNTIKEAHSSQPADFDLDGDQDLFVSHQVHDTTGYRDTVINGQAQKVPIINSYMKIILLQNNIGNKNNWVSVKLDAPTGCNKNAIGARITVFGDTITQISEIQTGLGHFAGEQPFIRNFGLGKRNRIDSIAVRWPMKDFPITKVYNPPLNMILEIDKNADLSFIKPWSGKKPIISFDRPALRFDTLYVGQKKVISFAVVNLGDTTLVVNDITLDSAAASIFSILNKQVPFSLEPNTSKTIMMSFSPLVRADYHKSVKFISNAQNAPERSFDLIGSGFAPASVILSDSSSLTFANAWIDSIKERSFVISNPGEQTLNISDFSIESDSADVFSIDKSSLPLTLQAKGTKTLTVSFKPLKMGAFTANLLIKSDAFNNPALKINLSGICDGPVPGIYASTLMLFSSVPINTFKEKMLAISNPGNADLNINNIKINDDTANVFSKGSWEYPITVRANDTFNLVVRFTPKDLISYKATMVIYSNALNDSTRTITLRGTGVPVTFVEETQATKDFLMKVLPNPVESDAKLVCELQGNETKSIHIELHSITGIKIRDILKTSINPGTYSYDLNTSGLATGVYFITADVEGRYYHVPFVILK
ncbi:MAG: choice-of-anchor D domain-containing protein [FCB group bacterium]|jgi:hypothetical protein